MFLPDPSGQWIAGPREKKRLPPVKKSLKTEGVWSLNISFLYFRDLT